MPLLIFLFPNFHTFFFSLTASATSSFQHHVSLWLHGPSDNPHVTCAVSIIFFICCQCSFTSIYFYSASANLSLTMLWYSSRLFLLELPYTHSWFKLLTPSFCCICLIHKHKTKISKHWKKNKKKKCLSHYKNPSASSSVLLTVIIQNSSACYSLISDL